MDGFPISAGRGRKAEIDPDNTDLVDSLTKAIELNPQNPNAVCPDLNLTKNKVIRFLKKTRVFPPSFSQMHEKMPGPCFVRTVS